MTKNIKKSLPAVDCWKTIGVWSDVNNKCEQLLEYVHCRNCPVFSEIGHSVFEKIAPSGYLSQWRKEIAAQAEYDNLKTNSVLVFRAGCEWFALPANILSEVANEREIHRIPRNTNRYISGIVNINGEVKVCYSLTELLDLSSMQEAGENPGATIPRRLIVIEFDDMDYVFLVDEVKGLHWYSDSDILPVPSTLNTKNPVLLLGSVQKFGQQIAIFDTEKFQEKLEGAVS